MTLEKNFLQNIRKSDYFKLFPKVKKENKQAYTTLVCTLLTLSFLGFFAISPTLSTIAQLQKELEDNRLVKSRLEEKISNLSKLQQEYTRITPRLPVVLAAIPLEPTTTVLAGQLQTLATTSNVTITRLQIAEVELMNAQKSGRVFQPSFTFSLGVEGSQANLFTFLSALANFDRIITIDSVSLSQSIQKSGTSQLSVRGKAYFQKQ